ncbi:hypothetical protein ACETIH_20815 [Microvirga arabica]|uniref:Uncharacterized protein n=1 Tax=Microvirga arabica TaxID=1128671 RepID=A0ABV6YCT9_9HYPH
MAADRQVIVQDLAYNTEKALRRGKKLEKTLLKVVAQSEPGSAAEEFLTSVRQGIKVLKKEAKKTERSLTLVKTKAVEKTKAPSQKEPAPKPGTVEEKPRRTANRSRKKAPATPEKASGSETPRA